MDELIKLTREQINRLRDRTSDAMKRRDDWLILRSTAPFVEGYLCGDANMHIHIVGAGFTNFCTVFQASLGINGEEFHNGAAGASSDTYASEASIASQDVDKPMFVGVVYLVEKPKDSLITPLPSVIRLQSLDSCAVASFQRTNGVGVPVSPTSYSFSIPSGTIQEDRERHLLIDWPIIEDSQLADEMVKGRAEIVSDLTDNNRPHKGNFGVIPIDAENIVSSLRIEFRDNDFVWMDVEEHALRLVESIDLLLCTHQFGTDAIERVHGYTTSMGE